MFENGISGAFRTTTGVAPFPVVTVTTLDGLVSGALTGKLSDDGKTLTVTSANALSKRYDVVVNNIKTKDGKDVEKYEKMITVEADKTAPTILGTEKLTATTVKVKFSEPMKAFAGVTFKYADGTAITAPGVTGSIAAGADEAVFTMGTGVVAGKEIIATFIGAQDQASNLLTPNPATVSFVKGAVDGVAPTVGAITQTSATAFSIKFSEQIQSAPAVTVGGVATTSVKDSADSTVYNYTLTTGVLDGAQTVAIATFTDLSGEVTAATNKVVTFVKDVNAPKVTSSAVVKDASNKEYLELTFDKDVVLTAGSLVAAATTNGSYVKDFVTTDILNTNLTDAPITYKSAANKKVVRFELDTLLPTAFDKTGAVYNLNLALTDVKSAAAVAIANTQVKFTRGEDGVAGNATVLGAPTITAGADNDKVNVSFPAAVDGASATNVANYKVDGAIVESVTLLPASGAQVAVLNLKADSNAFTGTRNISVSGVKALGSSKTMLPFVENTVSLKENVAPKVTSAKLTGTDKVTLTFSEAVITTSNATDFALLIGGATVASNDLVNTAANASPGVTSVEFTLEAVVTAMNISSGLSLKALNGLSIVDAAGNIVSVPTNITITQ